jgi:2',3'-cyclic-nucleotide 2'-phosphodiesterase (5'-nucleotidase family)
MKEVFFSFNRSRIDIDILIWPLSKSLGDISMGDVFTAMPWSNTVDVVTIPGRALKEMLEHSVSEYDPNHPDPGGRFLQLSGLVVTYEIGNHWGKG